MNLEAYQYREDHVRKKYEFYSEGQKGRIHKVVHFQRMSRNSSVFNLCFGDWDAQTGSIDDRSVTNNGDADKILATIAGIVVTFISLFEDAIIYAEGNTPARTRRYQIEINKFQDEIEEIFHIYGRKNNSWKKFQKNINYDAFMVSRIELILEEQKTKYMTSSSQNNKKEKIRFIYTPATVDEFPDVDVENDPVFLKKLENARKSLEVCPFPMELLEESRRRDREKRR